MTAESRIQLELRVLAALCAGTGGESMHAAARGRLASYAWSDAAHRAVFEVAMSFPSSGTAVLREQVPARLTRRGFPDFDFAGLFRASPDFAEAEESMKQLLEDSILE